MNSEQIQQGDVLFLRTNYNIRELKMKKVKQRKGRLIFAEGEATGHHHSCVAEPGVELYEDKNGTLWCVTEKNVTVTHQEHGAVTLSPGTYKVGRVVEVDPFEDVIREVAD